MVTTSPMKIRMDTDSIDSDSDSPFSTNPFLPPMGEAD